MANVFSSLIDRNRQDTQRGAGPGVAPVNVFSAFGALRNLFRPRQTEAAQPQQTQTQSANQPTQITQQTQTTPANTNQTTGVFRNQFQPNTTQTQPILQTPSTITSTTPDQGLTYPSSIRTEIGAGQFTPEQQRLMTEYQNLERQYTPLISAPLGQTSIGQGGKRLSDYELARFQTQLQGLQPQTTIAGEQAARALQAAQGVRGALAPQITAPGQVPFYPGTGTSGQMIGGLSGPFQAGQIQGQQALGQQYAANFAAVNQATGIKNQVQNLLATTPLNPSDFTSANQFIQLLSGQVGDPRYQTLSNYLNEYISTLAPILGVGGDATNLKTQIAQSMVNAQASGQSISTVLDNLEALAQNKLANLASAASGGPVTTAPTQTSQTNSSNFAW